MRRLLSKLLRSFFTYSVNFAFNSSLIFRPFIKSSIICKAKAKLVRISSESSSNSFPVAG